MKLKPLFSVSATFLFASFFFVSCSVNSDDNEQISNSNANKIVNANAAPTAATHNLIINNSQTNLNFRLSLAAIAALGNTTPTPTLQLVQEIKVVPNATYTLEDFVSTHALGIGVKNWNLFNNGNFVTTIGNVDATAQFGQNYPNGGQFVNWATLKGEFGGWITGVNGFSVNVQNFSIGAILSPLTGQPISGMVSSLNLISLPYSNATGILKVFSDVSSLSNGETQVKFTYTVTP